MTKVSIQHVAQSAGVSVATASRVISGANYPVNEKTRQRVLDAVAELGYTPNSLARGLKTQRSYLIGALVGDNADPYFAEIMRGVEEVCSADGYLTIVCNTDRKPEREMRYLQTLRDYRADGILFAGGGLSEPGYPAQLEQMVQELRQVGAVTVTLAQHTLQAPSVQADNFGGARQMAARLIALGHRRIAFIAGPPNLVVANVRLQGYMAALAEAGLMIDPTLILPGDFSLAGGEQAVQSLALLPTAQRPTALFAANDETALGALAGLRRLGLHVPRDVSVCGFGDLPVAHVIAPALTTVRIPVRELGRAGAQKMLALLRAESVTPLDVLPTMIIERESTARVADVVTERN
jgi:LacI family transcriptional regulator